MGDLFGGEPFAFVCVPSHVNKWNAPAMRVRGVRSVERGRMSVDDARLRPHLRVSAGVPARPVAPGNGGPPGGEVEEDRRGHVGPAGGDRRAWVVWRSSASGWARRTGAFFGALVAKECRAEWLGYAAGRLSGAEPRVDPWPEWPLWLAGPG